MLARFLDESDSKGIAFVDLAEPFHHLGKLARVKGFRCDLHYGGRCETQGVEDVELLTPNLWYQGCCFSDRGVYSL